MTYLILHGSFGGPKENWFTWLKLKLELEGARVYSPQLPVDDYENFKPDVKPQQNLQAWLKALKPILGEIAQSGDELAIVAHSIAPAFTLSLMQAEPELKLKLLVAVAPFLHHGKASQMWQFRKVNDSFLSSAENIVADQLKLNDIKNRIEKTVVVYGDNDPYVENEQSLEYAELLDAKVVEVKNGGHLNAEAGFTEFEQLLNLILDAQNS